MPDNNRQRSGARFSPPRGRCAPSCPGWETCRSRQRHNPDAPAICEWTSEAVGIDPTTPPEGMTRWDKNLFETGVKPAEAYDSFDWEDEAGVA